MRRAFGDAGLRRLIDERSRDQLRRYRKAMPGRGASLERRVAALAEHRSEEGYMADCSRERDGSLLLVENHCPICAAARSCQTLCRDELQVFRSALGKGARVERIEHLLQGARRCAYRIRPASGA